MLNGPITMAEQVPADCEQILHASLTLLAGLVGADVR